MRTARVLGSAGASVALATVALVAGLAACGHADAPAGPGGGTVAVTATDTSCALARTDLPAGVTTFVVTNTGSRITEFYIVRDDTALGEVENIGPQVSRNLTVELAAGSYQGVCKPGMAGAGIRTSFTVSGSAVALGQEQELARAVADYTSFVRGQATLLVARTREFTDAVRAGDEARARTAFAVARGSYEVIEPVAESFGDLDPSIDARDGDLDPGVPWTGFHAIEKHLWVDNDVSRDAPLADRLDADVARLAALVATVKLQPLQIANGAKELLDEVATSKITGEEDRYSHTDLWDVAANVAGVKAVVDALRPALAVRDAALLSKVDSAYATVISTLDKNRVGDGWRPYNQLAPADTRALADVVSGLAEPVSHLAAAISAPAPGRS